MEKLVELGDDEFSPSSESVRFDGTVFVLFRYGAVWAEILV
jgi:hypothetical protein